MNEQIQSARDVALNIFKPSTRDLDHGLELHQNALVIESYGLGLGAPVDPDIVNQAIEAGASWLVIGRPICAAENPRAAAEAILGSLAGLAN